MNGKTEELDAVDELREGYNKKKERLHETSRPCSYCIERLDVSWIFQGGTLKTSRGGNDDRTDRRLAFPDIHQRVDLEHRQEFDEL
jgi:hypothetical protein